MHGYFQIEDHTAVQTLKGCESDIYGFLRFKKNMNYLITKWKIIETPFEMCKLVDRLYELWPP